MLVFIILLGLAIGSFANAAVWRLKQQSEVGRQNTARKKSKFKAGLPSTDYSLLRGRSVCPNCKHQLAWNDLIPIFSWLALGGRCRYCKKPISKQYPIVEALTAVIFGWLFLNWNFSGLVSQIDFGLWLLIANGLIILAVYDIKWFELPHQVMHALIGLATLSLLVRAFSGDLSLLAAGLGAAFAAGGFFYALYVFSNGRWMGGGDVKLAFLMGLLLGWQNLGVAMMLGFLSAAIFSTILIAAKKLTRKDVIPFGPFLIAGTLIAKIYGTQIINAYLSLFLVY